MNEKMNVAIGMRVQGTKLGKKMWLIALICILTISMVLPQGLLVAQAAEDAIQSIHSYKFEEGSGTTTADTMGNAQQDATLMNDPQWVTGASGNGLSFNGTSSYVNFGKVQATQGNEFTIEAWVKPASTITSSKTIFSQSQSGLVPYSLWFFVNQGKLRLQMADKAGSGFFDITGGSVPVDQYSHVALTRNGKIYILYVNGQEVARKVTDADFDLSSNPYDALLGTVSGFSSSTWNGIIDEFNIYDKALTADTLTDHFNSLDQVFSITSITNGSLTVKMDGTPAVDPTVEDFKATMKVNQNEVSPLVFKSYSYESTTKVATFEYEPLQAAAYHKDYEVQMTYKDTKRLAKGYIFAEQSNVTDWFHEAGYGVGVHWTSKSIKKDGTQYATYQEAVDKFDVKKFAQQLEDAGAGYVLFTIDHVNMYLPFPSAYVDSLLEGRTSERDLMGELYAELEPRGIRMMFYFNWDVPMDGPFRQAMNFSNIEESEQHIYNIVDEIGNRYGEKLSGWWIDGMYDAGARFRPFTEFEAHLKTGNPNRLVAMSTLGQSWKNKQYDLNTIDANDYSPGESMYIGRLPEGRFSGQNGVQWHEFTHMTGPDWLHWQPEQSTSPNYSDQQVIDHIKAVMANGGVFTYNAAPYQDELISDAAMAQLKKVKEAIRYGVTQVEDYERVEDGKMTYSSGWSDYNGTHYAIKVNESAEYTFNGTSVALFGTVGTDHGMAEVYIDGVLDQKVDWYATSRKVGVPVYMKTGLSDGQHTIKIVTLAEKNPNAVGSYVELDYLYVEPAEGGILYQGEWAPAFGESFSGQTAHRTSSAGSIATFDFSGQVVNWVGTKGPDQGIAEVYIDGQLKDTIDLYAEQSMTQQTLYRADDLNEGPHTLMIKVTDQKNAASSGTNVVIDAVGYAAKSANVAPKAVLTGPELMKSGDSFSIQYNLAGAKDQVYGQDMVVNYDATKVELVSVTSAVYGTSVVGTAPIGSGKERVLSVNTSSTTDELKLHSLTLNFKVKAGANTGSTTISVSDIVVSNGVGIETPVKGASHNMSIQYTMPEVSDLEKLITEAQTKANAATEGSLAGQYPAGAKAALQTVIDAVKDVMNKPNVIEAEITEAIATLKAAIQKFIDSVHVNNNGDLNGDDKYSIGDLAMVATAYGKISADSDWDQYKAADMNKDNKVGIEDLTAVARLVLQ